MHKLPWLFVLCALLIGGLAEARGGHGAGRGGRGSGHYKSGQGSSHKGGQYKNKATNDHYQKRR